MTEKEFKKFAFQWSALNKHYRLHFPDNSLMFPEPFLIEFLLSKYSKQYKKNSSANGKRATYDLTDPSGKNVEVKSSFHFGACYFSANQNGCDRIIYVNLELDKFDFYEIDKSDVQEINSKNSNGRSCYFRKYTKNKHLQPFLTIHLGK